MVLPVEVKISIHALREEGDGKLSRWCSLIEISIHALREEGDPNAWRMFSGS